MTKMTRQEKITKCIELFQDGTLEKLPRRNYYDLVLEVGRYKVINPKKYKVEVPKNMRKYVEDKIKPSWFDQVERIYFGENK